MRRKEEASTFNTGADRAPSTFIMQRTNIRSLSPHPRFPQGLSPYLSTPTSFNDNVRQENHLRRCPRRLGLRSGVHSLRDRLRCSPNRELNALYHHLHYHSNPVCFVSHPFFLLPPILRLTLITSLSAPTLPAFAPTQSTSQRLRHVLWRIVPLKSFRLPRISRLPFAVTVRRVPFLQFPIC